MEELGDGVNELEANLLQGHSSWCGRVLDLTIVGAATHGSDGIVSEVVLGSFIVLHQLQKKVTMKTKYNLVLLRLSILTRSE